MIVYHGTSPLAAKEITGRFKSGELAPGAYVTTDERVAVIYARKRARFEKVRRQLDPHSATSGAILRAEVAPADLEPDDHPSPVQSVQFQLLNPAKVIGVEYVQLTASRDQDRRGVFTLGR